MHITGIKSMIVDMDGVLWRQNQPIGDLPDIFSRISQKNIKVCLATNNATLTSKMYIDKLKSFGVYLNENQIVHSSHAAKDHLHKRFPNGGSVNIVGESGLIDTLAEAGFYQSTTEVLAVVVGMDRQLTYEKLAQATLQIRNGAWFIATNDDRTFPTPQGLIPGVGAILALLETATDIKPFVVGKPKPYLYQIAMDRMMASSQETLVVGDRLETDILGGQEMGCKTAVVLSGVSDQTAAHAWNPPPDIICQDLNTLVSLL